MGGTFIGRLPGKVVGAAWRSSMHAAAGSHGDFGGLHRTRSTGVGGYMQESLAKDLGFEATEWQVGIILRWHEDFCPRNMYSPW